jgi:glycosyltransferase involved in cell wall biosynthesis
MHLLGALSKPRATPLVWHIHDYVQSRPMMAKLMKLSRQRCDIALVNSNSVGRDVAQACGAELSIRTIYNGIDTDVFAPGGGRLDLDSLAGLSAPDPAGPEMIRVGMLATMARWKGHEVFLRALSLIDPKLPLRGYIVGGALYQTDGSQTSVAALKAVAQRMGLADRVGFTGFVAEPAAAIRSLDIVVHASTQPEPFGLVIVEALACGRAVIVSEGGGAAELIQTENGDGPIALTHTPGNAEQLAACIKQLATDLQLRERLGVAGRASATERFNATRLATELAPIYWKLVARA